MQEILKDARGCMIYTEQIMRLLKELAGYTLEQAAVRVRQLRSECPGPEKRPMVIRPDRQMFLLDPMSRTFTPLLAGPFWQISFLEPAAPLLAGPARLAVGKSHFLSMAILSYQAAYLCCRYPEAYQKACRDFPETDLSRFFD